MHTWLTGVLVPLAQAEGGKSAMDYINTPYMVPIAGIACGLVIAVVAIISKTWRKARQAELEAALKQDMLNRGMSAQDIERVIKASRSKEEKE